MKKLVLSLLMLLAFLTTTYSAKTVVFNDVLFNQSWSDTIFVTDTIEVDTAVTLTINPGTVIISTDTTLIKVKGNILANGLITDYIYFLGVGVNTWDGFEFDGLPGQDSTILNYCSIQGGDKSMGGAIYLNNYNSMRISNSNFSYNQSSDGGAIYNKQSSIILTNTTFLSNSSTGTGIYGLGGAIYLKGVSSMDISSCSFNNNTADGNGGAMYLYSSSPDIIFNNITENTSGNGGGIYMEEYSSPNILNCKIDKNDATTGYGGGLMSRTYSSPTIKLTSLDSNTGSGAYFTAYSSGHAYGCTFSANSLYGLSLSSGGSILDSCFIAYNEGFYGLYLYKGTSSVSRTKINSNKIGVCVGTNASPIIDRCHIYLNQNSGNGGGIYFFSGGSGKITNSVIDQNRSNYDGSAVYIDQANPEFSNCTFTENTAGRDGTIFIKGTATPTFTNNIIYANRGTTFHLNEDASEPTINYCVIEDSVTGFTGDGSGVNYSNTSYSNIINEDPNLNLHGDYSLNDGSVCINAGIEDTTGLGVGAEDYLENARISGGRIDIGATEYEVATSIQTIENKNSDKLVIYPNPVRDIINVRSSIDGEIVIMNLQEKVVGVVSDNRANVSKLSKGIYFAVVKENGKIKAVKSFYKM